MKRNPITRTLDILLSLLLLVGAIPLAALPVVAQNIIGLMSASYIRAGEDVVLFGDTTLMMDQDLTVPSIQGDYHLTVEGSGKLTVNGGGNGIDVKSLHCTSDLFIQTGWHAIEVSETVYIQNADSFIVGGIYAGGHINIQSNNATIAGNGNAIFSSLGNITLSGGTFDIGANGIAVAAETGGIYMTGAFTVNSNNDRTINAAKGEVVVDGSLKSVSGAQFDPDVHFINRDNSSIGARAGFFFYGTTLEVEGLGGIVAGNYNGDTDISITADSVSIITERYYALNGGNIYVDSDNLWIENRGSEENENVPYTFHTIFADGDATLYSENGGIVGENCFYVDGNLTLNGNFVVGADHDSGYAMRVRGRTEVNGNLRVIAEDILCVYAEDGFSFNGSTLELEGYGGIDADGGVNITADNVSILAQKLTCVEGQTVYIDCDVLRLENVPNVNDPEVGQYGIACYESATVNCPDATIIACDHGVYGNGCDVTLNGNFTILGKGDFGKGIWASNLYLDGGQFTVASNTQRAIDAGRVEVRGNLSVSTKGEENCVAAQEFVFDGTTLTADGYSGIWGRLTEIHADSVVITTEVGAALDGDEVYVIANYLWAENKATKVNSDWSGQHGISAESKLALTVKGGTVIGYDDALHVYDENDQFEFHYIYVNGHLTAVSQTGVGMYAPQGIVELYGGPIVSVGESHGIHAKDVVFEGGSLRVEGDTGIYAISSVKLTGEDVRITAFNERRSGIWVENGYVDLKGKVVIKTNGWYGINADTHVAFEEGYYQIIGPKNDAQAVKASGFLYLDGTLEIIQPDGGHINGNVINGAGDSPAMELLMYSAVGTVDIYLSTPSDGQAAIFDSSAVYGLPLLAYFDSIRWFENGVEMQEGDLFTAGNEYSVELILSAEDGYYFAEGVLAKVNGKNSSMTGLMEGNTKLMIRVNLGKCNTAISQVELNITAPVDGNKPSTGVSTPSGAHYGVKGSNVTWLVSDDGITYTAMAAGAKFVGGKYYRVQMDVTLSNSNYSFKITTADGSLQPDVAAFVGGNVAKVSKAYDQDPEQVVTVVYDFGVCNDAIIEDITIVDVVRPVAGQHPTYTANASGTGYRIDSSKNSYYDAYWAGEKWYYVKNGISWWDVTDGDYDYVYENDVFLPGHEYKCQIYVVTESGYEFVYDVYNDVWPTATINGNYANVKKEGSGLMWEQQASYTFACLPQVIDTVIINGIDTPKAGNTPDYTASVGYPEYYQLESIEWYDCEYSLLYEDDRFGDAAPYRIALRIVSAQAEGVELVEFSSNVSVYIDGKPVTQYGQWDEVVVENGGVTVYYTYRKGSSAPEGEQVYSLSGTVSVEGATVTLLRGGDVVTTATANPSYSLDNLSVGIYTLQVTADGYEPFEQVVYITGSDVTLDVTLTEIVPAYIPGDVDDNGKVNNRDLGRLQQYLNDWDVTIDTDAADVDGNDKINNRDLGRLQQYLNDWDVEIK